MSNSNAPKSAINLTDNSITSDTLCNEHSPVRSIWWEDEHTFGPPFNPSDRGNQPPQYSWRQKATPDAHCAPLVKEDLNLRDLLRKKNHLLQNIALEYSRLVGLMQQEFVCSLWPSYAGDKAGCLIHHWLFKPSFRNLSYRVPFIKSRAILPITGILLNSKVSLSCILDFSHICN